MPKRIDLKPAPMLTADQIRAIAHASTSEELYVASFVALSDKEAEAAFNEGEMPERNLGNSGLELLSYTPDDGWLYFNYPWNTEGEGVWLAPDGGWHYQPGESGYYPWKED